MFFGKKSDYIKFSEVINILEEQRARHHYASRASIEAKNAVEDAINALKYYHIEQNPDKYKEWKYVYNEEARFFLKFRELEEGAE